MKHVVFLVDCSQSMVHISDRVYESLLLMLLKMQEKDEDIFVSYGGFNRNYYHCFSRKKAKYLSVLPQPFANGGTSIYSSIAQSMKHLELKSDDDVLYVVATDGRDESALADREAAEAQIVLRERMNNVRSSKVIFVSLSQMADIERTAEFMGFGPEHCVWGETIADMLNKFVTRVVNEL